jgi:hypothetical protein
MLNKAGRLFDSDVVLLSVKELGTDKSTVDKVCNLHYYLTVTTLD